MNQRLTHAQQDRLANDRLMLYLLLAHVPVVGLLVPWGYGTHVFALSASILVALLAGLGFLTLRGTRGFSVLVATCLMLFSAIMIQAQMGRIEMHFHIFGALAFIIVYRDWLPVVVAAAVITVHHLLLTALQLGEVSIAGLPIMIYNYGCSWSIAFLHAAFVVFEAIVLIFLAWRLSLERAVTHQMRDVVDEVGDSGNLSARLDVGYDDPSVEAFNRLMSQFEGVVAQVKALVERLKVASETLSSSSAQTNEAMETQREQMEQAASATEQMSQSVHEVAENAQQTSETAQNATTQAMQGKEQVEAASGITEATNESMGQASMAVNELHQRVADINAAVGSINDISDQTNLLALNAAIEAARAGEHGRGFAVVADEVRNLSRKTQDFTKQIQEVIQRLEDESNKALAAIDMGSTRSGETTTAVHAVGEAISGIEESIQRLNEMNAQIASAAEEQASTSSEINQNMQKVSDGNARASQEASNTDQMAREMESVAGELVESIKHFKAGH